MAVSVPTMLMALMAPSAMAISNAAALASQGSLLARATLGPATAPAMISDPSDQLCIVERCEPIGEWFDGPVAPRKLRRSWAVQLAPVRKTPTLARVFASRMRSRVRSMSPTSITIIGAIVNVVLAVAKITVGVAASSASLVADGWHSFGDLCSDVLCWTCHKIGARPADASHPDGYSTYEHIGTLAIAGMLAVSGVVMMLQSAGAALAALSAVPALCATRGPLSAVDLAALLVAVVSVASKELLFGATYAIGMRCRSPSIVANAYHHRSDALSSLVAIAGIGGVLCGRAWFDPLAATAVGLMVVAMGRDVAHESFEALFGTASRREVVPAAAPGLGQAAAVERWLEEGSHMLG